MSRFTVSIALALSLASLLHNNARVYGISTNNLIDSDTSSHEHPLGFYEIEESILKNLSKNPNQNRIRPNGTTHVKVNMYIRDVQMKTGSKVSYDLYYPWTVELVLRQSWNDPRLAYDVGHNADYKYFAMSSPKSIWKPDTFFPDSDKSDFLFVTTPNTFVWLYPNGDVLCSLRLSLSLPCRQTSVPRRFGHGIGVPVACPLTISSYGYTADQLTLDWEEEDPLQVNDNLYTQNNGQYCLLDKAVTNSSSQVHTRTGNFSAISSEFQFLC